MNTAVAESAAATPATELPPLGPGEIYRGITFHDGRLAHLIELPGEFTGTHKQCTEWAKAQGGQLPSRHDGIVLHDAKCGWASDWYWLEPQHASLESCAWIQSFGGGSQGFNHKDDRFRARAVRRVPIQ